MCVSLCRSFYYEGHGVRHKLSTATSSALIFRQLQRGACLLFFFVGWTIAAKRLSHAAIYSCCSSRMKGSSLSHETIEPINPDPAAAAAFPSLTAIYPVVAILFHTRTRGLSLSYYYTSHGVVIQNVVALFSYNNKNKERKLFPIELDFYSNDPSFIEHLIFVRNSCE